MSICLRKGDNREGKREGKREDNREDKKEDTISVHGKVLVELSSCSLSCFEQQWLILLR